MTLAEKAKRRARTPQHASAGGKPAAYATDTYSWALQQAELLRARRFDLIDPDNLADEIADVAHYLADKLRSDLVRVLQHLLKWDHQPERRGRSGMLTVREHRRRVASHLAKAPGLQAIVAATTADAYATARYETLIETGLPEGVLAETCPYSWDEIMSRPIEWPDQP